MGAPVSATNPLTVRALELLEDGQWHDREAILRELMRLITPGVAFRVNETARVYATGNEVRTKPITEQRAVISGARRKALLTLNRARRIERRLVDGVTEIRLRPPLPLGRPAPSGSTRESS